MQRNEYKKLTVKGLQAKYDQGERCFREVDLRGQNLKKADLQGANFSNSLLQGVNFSEADLEYCNFSNTQLQGANFSKAKLAKAKFNGAKTGMNLLWSLLYLIITSVVIYLGIYVVFIIATLSALPFYLELLEDSQSKTQYMTIIAYILIFMLGLLHFWATSLLRNMDEAVWGIFMTIVAIILSMIGQPITNALAWLIILYGLIRVIKVLFDWNYIVSISLIIVISVTIGVVLYKYDFIINNSNNSFLLPLIAGVIIASIISSLSVAIVFAEISIVTYQKRTVILLIPLFSLVLTTAITTIITKVNFFGIIFTLDEIFIFTVSFIALNMVVFSIIILLGSLGVFIGRQALKDNPNYRFVRDCGVWLCQWVGTDFREADLTEADFSGATLHNANFTKATLKHTCWNGAKRMEYARFGNSYLRYPKIRKLLKLH